MRTKTKRSAKKTQAKTIQPKRKEEVPLEDYLEAAEAAATSFDVEKAIQIYSRAATLLRQGRSTSVETREWQLIHTLEKIGELKVSIGDQDGAVNDFREALEILETENKTLEFYDTYVGLSMYIGQLCVEHEARLAYEQGVSCLESCMSLAQRELEPSASSNNTNISNQLQELSRKLCVAYCAIAELYLTDLCFEEDAEKKCELLIEKALHIKDTDGEPVVDALQTMASLRLSQPTKRNEAACYILRAYERMRVGCDALADLVGISEPKHTNAGSDEKPKELHNVEAANSLPEFEFRCQTAKLLLECAEQAKESSSNVSQHVNQCISAAIAVLGSLLAENDEVVEIWFLSGCAFASKTPSEPELALYYLRRSMEMLLDIKKSLEQEAQFLEPDDQTETAERLIQNESLLADVQSKLAQIESAATSG